jgi:hypothetical protein
MVKKPKYAADCGGRVDEAGYLIESNFVGRGVPASSPPYPRDPMMLDRNLNE